MLWSTGMYERSGNTEVWNISLDRVPEEENALEFVDLIVLIQYD